VPTADLRMRPGRNDAHTRAGLQQMLDLPAGNMTPADDRAQFAFEIEEDRVENHDRLIFGRGAIAAQGRRTTGAGRRSNESAGRRPADASRRANQAGVTLRRAGTRPRPAGACSTLRSHVLAARLLLLRSTIRPCACGDGGGSRMPWSTASRPSRRAAPKSSAMVRFSIAYVLTFLESRDLSDRACVRKS
jgi:hypothetical protein